MLLEPHPCARSDLATTTAAPGRFFNYARTVNDDFMRPLCQCSIIATERAPLRERVNS